ncbi:hypothetical protein B0A52_09301 [Exophiala mesophila]|uniref:Uncharacterized protein n=1 Tax=Exophiala mesophila TaxID=212818 RepID=A0A438MU78_EXOME|nr:hypothetical protein B0A52_09301 [Exophiala mesophila]
MAPSRQAQQSISGLISNAIHSPYVCCSCRTNVRIYAQRPKPSSRLWSKTSAAALMPSSSFHTSASTYYATPAPQDYIHPKPAKPQKVDEDLEDFEEYQEAETWDGLEVIGHKQKVIEEKVSFAPFIPTSRPMLKNETLEGHFSKWLYVAILDTVAEKSLGHEIGANDDVQIRRAALKMSLTKSGAGAVLSFDEHEKTIQEALGENEAPSWKNLDRLLSENESKISTFLTTTKLNFKDATTFKILKRFAVLSGHRVPDPVVGEMWKQNRTLSELVTLLTKHYRRARKQVTADIINERQQQASLAQESTNVEVVDKRRLQPLGANVVVHPRRETPVDKEKEVGRWKVIVKELEKRQLPIPGRRGT